VNDIRKRLSRGVYKEVKESKVIKYIEKNFIGKKLCQIEYYKYFFGNEMQVIPLPDIDKKKKRKYKKHLVKNSSKLKDEEIKNGEVNNDEIQVNELLRPETETMKNKEEVQEVTTNEVEKLKELSDTEVSQSIPHDTKTEDTNESTQIDTQEPKVKKKHNGKLNRKAKNKVDSAIKKEYEELKMNTIKFFKQSTLIPKKFNKPKQEINNEITEEVPNQKRIGKYWGHKGVIYRKKDLSVKEVQEYELLYCNDMPTKKLNEVIDNVILSLNIYNEVLYAAQEVIIKVIEDLAIKCFHNSSNGIKATLYGSVAIGLALEDSDIDIILNNIVALSNEEYISNLLKLGGYLKNQAFVNSATTITTARVPVIKLVFTSYLS
jgi:predicted nucleotidyltransferase